jgi:hypothetical protein
MPLPPTIRVEVKPMNLSIKVVLLLAALICELLAAFQVASKINFMCLGFACVIAAFLFG